MNESDPSGDAQGLWRFLSGWATRELGWDSYPARGHRVQALASECVRWGSIWPAWLSLSLTRSFSHSLRSLSPFLLPFLFHSYSISVLLSSACVLSLSLSPSFSLSTHPRLIEDWTQLKWLKQKSQTPFSCGGGGPADIGHVLMYWQGRVIWTESRPNQIRRPDPYRSVSLCRMLIISDWEERGKPEEPAGTSSHLRQWINWQAIEYLSAADVMWNGKAADV